MRSALLAIIALFAGLSWVACWEEIQIVRLREQVGGIAAQLKDDHAKMAEIMQKLSDAAATQAKADARVAAMSRNATEGNSGALAPRKDLERWVVSHYADTLRQLNLPPLTREKLQDLLIARGEARADAREAAEKEGIADGSPEMARAIDQSILEVNRDIAVLLGTQGYQQFKDLAARQAR